MFVCLELNISVTAEPIELYSSGNIKSKIKVIHPLSSIREEKSNAANKGGGPLAVRNGSLVRITEVLVIYRVIDSFPRI